MNIQPDFTLYIKLFITMSRRERLELEVEEAKKRIEDAPEDTPIEIRKTWEEELVQLEFDLNNFVDEDDNNE